MKPEPYEKVEDDLVRLTGALKSVGMMDKFLRRPTEELRKITDSIHQSCMILSQYIEHVAKEDQKPYLVEMLNKAEKIFMDVLRKYPSLNKWHYLIK
jgi:hypothetical protein